MERHLSFGQSENLASRPHSGGSVRPHTLFSTQAGARNGFGEPRDRDQNRRYRDFSRQQRPYVPHLNPRMPANRGLFVRDQKTPVRIGLRGWPGRIPRPL
jgi:hypothetical protein